MTEKEKEIELIRAAQDGDASSFETLINMNYTMMFKMAYSFIGNKQDAEDIAQDACIKLARGIHSFRFDSKFSSWLCRLVINTGKDWLKKNSRHSHSTTEKLELEAITENAEEKTYARQVLGQLYNLPEAEREAILLVMVHGHSHKEAGEILGVKEGTISSRIFEARKKLNAFINEERSAAHG